MSAQTRLKRRPHFASAMLLGAAFGALVFAAPTAMAAGPQKQDSSTYQGDNNKKPQPPNSQRRDNRRDSNRARRGDWRGTQDPKIPQARRDTRQGRRDTSQDRGQTRRDRGNARRDRRDTRQDHGNTRRDNRRDNYRRDHNRRDNYRRDRNRRDNYRRDRNRRDYRRDNRRRDYRRNYGYNNYGHSNYGYGRNGYRTNYRSSLGINFVFGNPGYSSYRWASTPYSFYQPGNWSYSNYYNSVSCQRINVMANHHGHSELISVNQCYNPIDGYYIIQGSERIIDCPYG